MPHDHHHGPSIDPARLARYQTLAEAVTELLIEKNIISSDEIDDAIKRMDERGPALGARMVARAWSNSHYKESMLSDGSAAAEALGIPVDGTKLVVVENTEKVQPRCMHSLLLLPPQYSGPSTQMVQEHSVSRARNQRAKKGLEGVWNNNSGERFCSRS